ncbi:MAG: prepilin-type N-terminal cleavage/methylation domain-containing protein, partial [Phycisphaerae bacterium]|nr:prepilin-type N-terminal cleavage/methylation domain-containing protein [Phycisphaerae bacterium]
MKSGLGFIKTHTRIARGFTLIELLVVIAIISLLVSILLPSLTKAKQLAQETVCMSNQRNCGTATHMYMGDHDEQIMLFCDDVQYYATWSEWLKVSGLISGWDIARCPTQKPFRDDDLPAGAQEVDVRFYCYGARISEYMYPVNPGGGPRKGYRMYAPYGGIPGPNNKILAFQTDEIDNPSRHIHLADSAFGLDSTSRGYQSWDLRSLFTYLAPGGAHFRHNDNCNLWFLDGHVEAAAVEE